VAADDTRHQALVAQVVEAALLAVALPGREHQRQVARLPAGDETLRQRRLRKEGPSALQPKSPVEGASPPLAQSGLFCIAR